MFACRNLIWQKKIGVTRQYISKILSGKHSKSDYFPIIATELQCSVDWLVSGSDPQPAWMSAGVSNKPTTTDDRLERLESKLDALTALLQSRPCTAGTSARISDQPEEPFHLVPPSQSRVTTPR